MATCELDIFRVLSYSKKTTIHDDFYCTTLSAQTETGIIEVKLFSKKPIKDVTKED